MPAALFEVDENLPPWGAVLALAENMPDKPWILVGGLMTQIHAGMAGYVSRTTRDIDVLVDVLSDGANVGYIVACLKRLGYRMQEPGLRGSPFHRMTDDTTVVDILVVDHLPSHRRETLRINRWPLMHYRRRRTGHRKANASPCAVGRAGSNNQRS